MDNKKIKEYAVELGVEIDIFHSNIEGEVINKFYEAHGLSVVGAIINPILCGMMIRYMP